MTLNEVYAFLDELWWDNNMFFCWGCGRGGNIEHHHIISRQDMRKIGKPELLTDPENIIPLCSDCHRKWHDGGIKDKVELICFSVILDYYQKEAPELYESLKQKTDDLQSSKTNRNRDK